MTRPGYSVVVTGLVFALAAPAIGCQHAAAGQAPAATAPAPATAHASATASAPATAHASATAPASGAKAGGTSAPTLLTAGTKAPDFSAPADNGKTITLSKLEGKPVVLYFYPKDGTPG